MFIVWGTKSRQEDGGVVGDWCDVCRGPNFHKLTNFFKVSHVYYISLGKGEYVGSTRQCTQCGTTVSCTGTAYTRVLTHQEAYGWTIEQILQATNPALFEQVHKQRALEYQIAQRMAQSANPAPGSPLPSPLARQADQRMLNALQTLGTLDARAKDVSQFLDRLQKWDYLSASECEVLLHEIDAFVTEDRNVHAAIHFMKMLPIPTPAWIGYVGCLTGIVGVIVGFTALPFLQSWLWGPLFLVLAITLWFFASTKATNKAVRGWVESVLVPRIRDRGVDARYFVGLLAAIKASGKGHEEKIADMARNVDLIADELVKHGLLTQEEEAPAALLSAPPIQQ